MLLPIAAALFGIAHLVLCRRDQARYVALVARRLEAIVGR